MKYDVFLAGPWEQYAKEPYKSRLKENLPMLRFYDPETDADQRKNGEWFKQNYEAMVESEFLISHECSFPGAGSTRETGIFYGLHGDGLCPLENMVMMFFPDLQPSWGLELAQKMGIVVANVQEAENYIKEYFGISKED